MNERSEYRNQNAEAPTTSAFDAPQVPPGIAPAANDEGASAGIISHNAPRQLNPMGKAIAVVLSVLLVLTCWNSYSIEEARRMIIGDDAVPMASTGSGDELLDEVDDENIDQASNDVEGEGDVAEGDDASGGEDADDTAADDTVSEADMQAYLPKDLLDAEKVMPALADATLKQEKDGILTPATTSEDDLKAAFANRFSFSLAVANALRASDDAYHVGGTNLAVAPSLGNTNVSFDGGYLGGAEDNDAVVLTFEAPFLYKKSDGTYGTTLSEEEWKARGAAADDMRALFAVSSLPAGWTVFTKHGEQYQKRTAEELAAGLSGTIVLRYEGVQDEHGITVSETRGQMPAGTELPRGFMWLTEAVPATEKVSVNAGFALCSYTPAANEDGTPKGDYLRMNYADAAAATAVLVNAAPQASLDASLAAAREPVMDAERGFAAFTLTLKSALGAMTEDSYTLRVSDLPDTAEGKGKLSADAVVAFDATDLTDEELASVNPADPATIEALGRSLAEVSAAEDGVADITFAAEEGDALALDAVTGAVDGTRVLYVAVPYAAADLTETEDGAAYNAEEPSFMLWSYETAKAVQEEKAEGAESVNDTLADEKLTFVSDLGTQSIAFPKPAAPEPEPEPEPEPADEPTNEQQPADEPATDEPAEGTDGEEAADEPAEEDVKPFDPDLSQEPAVVATLFTNIEDVFSEGAQFGDADPLETSLFAMSRLMSAPSGGISTFSLVPTRGAQAMTQKHFDPNIGLGGSGFGNDLGGNTYLLNDKDAPSISLQIKSEVSDGFMGGYTCDTADPNGYRNMATSLVVNIPYLYQKGENVGALASTYDFTDWVSKNNDIGYTYINGEGQKVQASREQSRYFSVTINKSVINRWYVYLETDKVGNKRIPLDNIIVQGFSEKAWGEALEASTLTAEEREKYRDIDFTNGFTGRLRFVWHGAQDPSNPTGYSWQMDMTSRFNYYPQLDIKMNGAIPENAGGTITMGGTAYCYTDGKGNPYYPTLNGTASGKASPGTPLEAAEGEPGNQTIRKITLLKTNLAWKSTYEAISNNVMYDRYNYMVYKVTTKNVSEGESEIDRVQYFLNAMSEERDSGEGITREDQMTWLADGNKAVGNPEYYKSGTTWEYGAKSASKTTGGSITAGGNEGTAYYRGVPNEGGVLIYNTTDWNDQDYKDLDTVNFSNLDEIMNRHRTVKTDEGTTDADGNPIVNTPSLPYQTTGQAGRIVVTMGEDDGGHLYPEQVVEKGDILTTDPKAHSEVTLLVAVPFTTNIKLQRAINQRIPVQQWDSDKHDMNASYYHVTMNPLTTIFFGKLGDDDYSWSDSPNRFAARFHEPSNGLQMNKYIEETWEGDVNEATKRPEAEITESTNHSYLGYPVSYVLTDFASTGNMPLYGANVNKVSVGPEIDEQLPNYFKLYNLEFEVDREEGQTGPLNFSNYFDDNVTDFPGFGTDGWTGSVVQFEVTYTTTPDPSKPDQIVEQNQWINMGVPEKDTAASTDDKLVYRLGGTDEETSLYTIMSERKLGTSDKGIGALPGVSANDYNFTGRMRIVLRGPMKRDAAFPIRVRVNGVLVLPEQFYDNEATAKYTKRIWSLSGSEPQYVAEPPLEYDTAMAEFRHSVPTEPTLTAHAINTSRDILFDESKDAVLAAYDEINEANNKNQPIFDRSGAGWRFELNNASMSKMTPASLTIGDLYNSNADKVVPAAPAGFDADKIGISQDMLSDTDIESVTISYWAKDNPLSTTWSKKSVTYRMYDDSGDVMEGDASLMQFQEVERDRKGNPKLDANGKEIPYGLEIPASAWKNGYLIGVKVKFKSIKGSHEIDNSHKHYVEIQGTPKELDKMTLTGTFKTDYEDIYSAFAAYNEIATASATFKSRKAPYVLEVDARGMRESQTPGFANAVTGDLETIVVGGQEYVVDDHDHYFLWKKDSSGNVVRDEYGEPMPDTSKCYELDGTLVRDGDVHEPMEFQGYIGNSGSGWRIQVSNDSDYAIGPAVISAGVMLNKNVTDAVATTSKAIPYMHNNLVNYEAEGIAISPKLFTPEKETVTNEDGSTEEVDHLKGGILDDLEIRYCANNEDPNSKEERDPFIIDGLKLRAATDTLTEEDYELADPTKTDASQLKPIPTKEQLKAEGIYVADNGFLVIESKAWASATRYIVGYNLRFTNFGYGLTQADNAYVDLYGTVKNTAQMEIGAVWATDYPNPKWNTGTNDVAMLEGAPYPAKGIPIVKAGANLSDDPTIRHTDGGGSDEWHWTSGAKKGLSQKAYYDYESRYKVFLGNDTRYDISLGGTLTLGPLPIDVLGDDRIAGSKTKLVDYETRGLRLSHELFQKTDAAEFKTEGVYNTATTAGKMMDMELYYYDSSEEDRDKAIIAAQLAKVQANAGTPLAPNEYQNVRTLSMKDLVEYINQKKYSYDKNLALQTTTPADEGIAAYDKPTWWNDDYCTIEPNGDVVIGWEAWDKGFLIGVKLDYATLNRYVKEGTNAYVEFIGGTTNRGDYKLNAKFKTRQAIEEWTRSWESDATLHSVLPPIRPNTAIGAYGYEAGADDTPAKADVASKHVNYAIMDKLTRETSSTEQLNRFRQNYWSQYPACASEVTLDKPISFRNEYNSGYRAEVVNDSGFPMYLGATLTIGNLTPRWDNYGEAKDKNIGFRTKVLSFSKGLIDNSEIEFIKVKASPQGSKYQSGQGLKAGLTDPPALSIEKVIWWEDQPDGTQGLKSMLADPTNANVTQDANGNILVSSKLWGEFELYYAEVHFNKVNERVTRDTKAWVDLFGYSIDSCNVSWGTDPYHTETRITYQEGDSYRQFHIGETHGWGCGGGWPNKEEIARRYIGYRSYVDNYYVVIEGDSEFKATYPNSKWDRLEQAGVNYNGAPVPVEGPNADGEQTWANDQANLYAIAGMPLPKITAKAYFDTTKTAADAIASDAPENLSAANTVNANDGTDNTDVGAKAFWGDKGAGYRFNLSNIGNNYKNKPARDMFESELRIGTSTNHYATTDTPWGQEIANAAVPGRDDVEEYEQAVRGFQTEAIMLNKYLLSMTELNYLTFTYYEKEDPANRVTTPGNLPTTKKYLRVVRDEKIDEPTKAEDGTVTSNRVTRTVTEGTGASAISIEEIHMAPGEFDAEFINAKGDMVVPRSTWNDGFLTNAVVRFHRVKCGMELAKAFADVWGYADDVRDMPLSAWFGCTYPYSDWHYNYISRDQNGEQMPAVFGRNLMGYGWDSWATTWNYTDGVRRVPYGYRGLGAYGSATPLHSEPSDDRWGFTRQGKLLYYKGGLEQVDYTSDGDKNAPVNERQVADYKTYWTGDDVFSDGAVTAFIYGRPYEVNEAITPETFMRSTGVTNEKGYDDTASGVDQSTKLAKSWSTNAYYTEGGSGFRFTLTNNKAPLSANDGYKPSNTMLKAYFSTTKIPYVEDADATDDKKRYVNFHTENIALSKELFDVVGYKDETAVADRAGVKDLSLYWRQYKADADSKMTIKGSDLEAIATGVLEETGTDGTMHSTLSDDEWINADNARVYKDAQGKVHVVRLVNETDADGNVVMEGEGDAAKPKKKDGPEIMYVQEDGDLIITEAMWDGWYFRNLEMHLRNFKGEVTAANRAFVEFWGTGDWRWPSGDVYAMLRTDWITGWWNTNSTNSNTTSSSYGSDIINGNFAATSIANTALSNYTRWDYRWITTNSYTGAGHYTQYDTGNGTYNVFSKFHIGNAPYAYRTRARLNVVLLPVRPKVEMWAYKDASVNNLAHSALTAKYETDRTTGASSYRSRADWGTQPRAYFQDESVGYRAVVTNDSRYDIDAGVKLTLGTLTPNSSNLAPALLGNVGFRTTKLSLSRALFDAGQQTIYIKDGVQVDEGTAGATATTRNAIKKITLQWYDRDAKATRNELTATSSYGSSRVDDVTTHWDYLGGHRARAGLPVYANGYSSTTTAGTPLRTTTYSGARVASWFAGSGDINEWLSVEGESFYTYDAATDSYTLVTATDGSKATGADVFAAQTAAGQLYLADGASNYLAVTVQALTDDGEVFVPAEKPETSEAPEGTEGTDETTEETPAKVPSVFEYRFTDMASLSGVTVTADGDVVLDPSKWLGGDLASVTIEYDWYKGLGKGYDASATASKEAYVDFFGYSIDSPDVDKVNAIRDTWCINDGFDANDGGNVTSDMDWFYDIIDLPANFHTTYNKRTVTWNGDTPVYTNVNWDNLSYDNSLTTWKSYSPNGYGELNHTYDYGEMFAHMPASSQKVVAKTFFADNPEPLISDTATLSDTTRAYLNYYGAGWRFTYTNYANPTNVFRSNSDKTHQWNYAANIYDRDYEMFDSYIEIGAMPADKVPDGGAGTASYNKVKDERYEYANDYRSFDAKYVTMTAGLLSAATWSKLGTTRGNAVKKIAITAKPAAPRSDMASDDDDAEADPATLTAGLPLTAAAGESDAPNVKSTETKTNADGTTTVTVTYNDGHTKATTSGAGADTVVVYTYDLATIVAHGAFYDNGNAATGNLVLPCTLWDKAYLSKVRVDMAHFNAGVKEADKASIEVLGAADVSKKNVTLQSVFNTNYKENGYLDGAVKTGNWDHQADLYGTYSGVINGSGTTSNGNNYTVSNSLTDQGFTLDKYNRVAPVSKALGDGLYGYSYQHVSNGMDRYDSATLVPQVDPIKPSIEVRTLVSEEAPADSGSYVEYDKQAAASTTKDYRCVETLLGTENSGWRFYLSNNSAYALDHTRFTASGMYSELVDGEWRGFDLKTITFNEPMLLALLAEKIADMDAVTPSYDDDPVKRLAQEVAEMEIQSSYNAHPVTSDTVSKMASLTEEQMKKLLEGYTIDLYTVKRDDATQENTAATKNANGSYPAKMPTAPTYTVNLSDYVKQVDVIVQQKDADNKLQDVKVKQWVVQVPAAQGWDGESRDGWPGTYVLKTVMHLPSFASSVTFSRLSSTYLGVYGGQEPFIDFHGVPSRAVHMQLHGTFSTEYKTDSWNSETSSNNNAYTTTDETHGTTTWSCMIPLTAEPAMRTTFNWSGGQTGETHYTVSVAENGYNVITPSEIANPRSLQGRTGYVPYRWRRPAHHG